MAYLKRVSLNSRYRYTGKVLLIEDSEPALGAGGREFESLHPDTLKPHIVKDMGFFCFRYLGKMT